MLPQKFDQDNEANKWVFLFVSRLKNEKEVAVGRIRVHREVDN